MKLKAWFQRWFSPPATREEAIQRYRRIATREALAGLGMLLLYFTVPAWADEGQAEQFSALFLAIAGLLVVLAGATIWGAALIKRDLYY